MKALPWVLVTLLLIVCVAAWFRPHKSVPVEVIRDTVEHWDTVKDPVPYPVYITEIDSYPVLVPVYINQKGDTVHDTITVFVPISQSVYETELYKAWVSGYRAKLDSIDIYNKVQTIYVRKQVKKKRWGLGVQVGYGYPDGFYVGAGVSYNLWKW
ncbi:MULTISPECIES: DUF6808 domain-containing protein [Bacteroides]|uniref:DUF6808 domain-containing protein n=1 Tax=Bacteroides TaxID=816 RepID=UPI002A81825E|nr:hypothetical protein [Bacteroides nordii]